MNFNLLFENFDSLLDSSEKINQLNQSILQLAVQGKLVPQDPSDEPASELIIRIKEEKAKLIKEGKLKKEKPLPAIKNEEVPYQLPEGWKWVRLGNIILNIRGGGTPSKNKSEYWNGDICWASVKDINHGMYIHKTIDKITREAVESSSTIIIPKGNVIVCTRMGLGKIGLNEIDIAINQDLKAIWLDRNITRKFFYHAYMTLDIKGTGTTVSGIRQEILLRLLFPLPPINEQKRIVEKIEELFNQTKEIESKLKEREDQIVSLNSSALHHLLNSKDNEEFSERFQFIIDNFDLLYSDDRNVKELKQAILQLAVQGKLVPQEPSDEPASELIKRIKEEKAKLLKEGEIKKEKHLPPIKPEEIPYNLPDNWEWVRLHDVYDVRDGTHDTPKYLQSGIPLITSKNLKEGKIEFSNVKFISLEDHEKISQRSKVDIGDILFAMIGTIGNPAIVENEGFSIKNVALFKYYKNSLSVPKYLYYYLQHSALNMQNKSSGGVQSFVSLTYLRNYIKPLPPLNEQIRIVEKIDNLMKLCDELEARITQSKEVSEQFFKAVLNTNTN